jgi:hypothetical protein
MFAAGWSRGETTRWNAREPAVEELMSEKVMTATEPDWLRAAISKHRAWIESVAGVPLEKTIVLEVANNFTSLPVRQIMRDVRLAKPITGPTAKLRRAVNSIEYPEGMPPFLRARLSSTSPQRFATKQAEWEISWGDTLVALRFPKLRGAIIAFELPYSHLDATSWNEIVICRQDEVALVMEMVRESCVRQDAPLFSTGKGFKSVKSSHWDDLILDATIQKLIRNDYESFFAREQWFRSLRLPFRRGYLLHGPPGNGKTSVIRAMLSRPGVCGLTLNFFASEIDDDDLEGLFDRAGRCAPALIVMEDIDRAFPKQQSPGTRCALSQQQLLNCLDGIATQDGVVVVATANEPTALDPAILRRPGRFDRVVLFPNPTSELRLLYLRRLNSQLKESELQAAIDLSEGFSFAQLREAYILAGQMAYERETEIDPEDILSAVQTLRRGFAVVRQRRDAAGFEPTRNLGQGPDTVCPG